jgi:hypothetical protein
MSGASKDEFRGVGGRVGDGHAPGDRWGAFTSVSPPLKLVSATRKPAGDHEKFRLPKGAFVGMVERLSGSVKPERQPNGVFPVSVRVMCL